MCRREPNRRPWAAHRISRISRDNCPLLWAWMAPDTGPCCSRWTHYCPHSCCSPGLEVATGSPCCFASLPLRSKARAGAPDSWCMAYSHTLPQQQGGWGSLMSAGITQMGVRFNVLLRLIRWRITKQQETSKKKKIWSTPPPQIKYNLSHRWIVLTWLRFTFQTSRCSAQLGSAPQSSRPSSIWPAPSPALRSRGQQGGSANL